LIRKLAAIVDAANVSDALTAIRATEAIVATIAFQGFGGTPKEEKGKTPKRETNRILCAPTHGFAFLHPDLLRPKQGRA
jgi:hypothetical protein